MGTSSIKVPQLIFNSNPLSANPTKWSNTLKQFVGKLPTNCLCVSDHFVGLALKGLRLIKNKKRSYQFHKVFYQLARNSINKHDTFISESDTVDPRFYEHGF